MDSDVPDRPKGPTVKELALPVLVGSVVVLLFAWIVGAGLHSPKPHGVPIAVAAPTAAAEKIQQQMAHQAPGVFKVTVYQDSAAARHAVADQKQYGALLLGPSGAQVVINGVIGTAAQDLVQTTLTGVAEAGGAHAQVTKIGKFAHQDPLGLAAFFITVGLLLGSVVFTVFLLVRVPDIGPLTWLATIASFSVVAGLTGALTGRLAMGAFGGRWWLVAAVAALLALVASSTVTAFRKSLGVAGFPLAALLLIPFSVATSGAQSDRHLLPAFYRWASTGMPGWASVTGMRNAAYLDGRATGRPVIVLAIWAVVAALVALGAFWARPRDKEPQRETTDNELAAA